MRVAVAGQVLRGYELPPESMPTEYGPARSGNDAGAVRGPSRTTEEESLIRGRIRSSIQSYRGG
jgi:hypothetical protein